jgi:hypothetical protein
MEDILDPIFSYTIEADWVNCDSATWRGTWINPFECLGELEAACLPPPQLDDWHAPTYDFYCRSGIKDPAIAALEEGKGLEDIEKLFVDPKDLLRWQVDGVDGDHQNLVYIALTCHVFKGKGHNVEVLDHLLRLSPKHFMQQLTMTSFGYANQGPLHTVLCSMNNAEKAADILAVVKWMCRTGVMTDTVFTYCAGTSGWGGLGQKDIPPLPAQQGVRPEVWKSATAFAREKGSNVEGMADVIAELERWEKLPAAEKQMLTEDKFEDLLAPALPKKVVAIKVKGSAGYSKPGCQVECCSLSGELIATIDINQDKDSAWLIARIADTLDLAQSGIRVITSNGEILQQAPPVPLSECSL